VLQSFAPADHCLGLHWHHFNEPLLPPIIPTDLEVGKQTAANKILVYLPCEEIDDIRSLLQPFASYDFYVYHRAVKPVDAGHLHYRSFCRGGFVHDLAESAGVIMNAGFALSSEALHLGKKILVKPLLGQMEQLSNAKALDVLGLGTVAARLDHNAVAGFLAERPSVTVSFPDVARLIADWIEAGDWADVSGLSRAAWEATTHQIDSARLAPASTTAGKSA
jgi:uncharacterized protein (TIGR00661 family)